MYVFLRALVYATYLVINENHAQFAEIIERVRTNLCAHNPLRPDLSLLTCSEFVTQCIKNCWSEDPDSRPDFRVIRVALKPLQLGL